MRWPGSLYTSHMLLLGHRGSPQQFPENTLPSFEAARQAGLDGVEWDVRRLADGTLAVHHDASLPDGRQLSQMRQADLPSWLPTLIEALAWAAQSGSYVNVELKFETVRPDDRVARTVQLIEAFGLSRRVLLSSFHPLQLVLARQLAPQIERALLIHRRYPLALLSAAMNLTGSAALHPPYQVTDKRLVDYARQRGWRVNVWTVNIEAEVARLKALGVSGLIGDCPAALLEARK